MLTVILRGLLEQGLGLIPLKTLLTTCAALLILSGCVSFGSIQKNLDAYRGRPLDDAVRGLGYPTTERSVAGHHIFTWSDSHTAVLPSYTTSSTTGAVSGQPFSATTGSWGTQNIQAYCEVTMEVNEDKIVTNVTFSGNHAGCDRYGS